MATTGNCTALQKNKYENTNLILFIQYPPFFRKRTNDRKKTKGARDDDKITQVENGLVGAFQSPGEHPANIKDRMAFYHIHGLSIAVIQNYHLLWAKGYGWADSSQKIPVTTATLFQAASISKSLNGVGLLTLFLIAGRIC